MLSLDIGALGTDLGGSILGWGSGILAPETYSGTFSSS